jgi:hypothetical protein
MMDKFNQDLIPAMLNEVSYIEHILDQDFVDLSNIKTSVAFLRDALEGRLEVRKNV